MRVDAAFTTSAADARGVPRDGLPQIALAGRSNVGKSSLINALAGRRIARTSAAAGKTRLANFYRFTRGALTPFYLVDLPGYGYARGQRRRAEPAFEAMVAGYFGFGAPVAGVIHAVDARHPGLESDLGARDWLAALDVPVVVVATKFDKLSRAERTRAPRELEHVLNSPVLPVSAVTGEGMDDLWKHLTRLLNPPRPSPQSPHRPSSSSPR